MRVAVGFSALLLAAGLCLPDVATAQTEAQISRSTLTGNIQAMEKLPIGGLTAVEGDGFAGMAFISDNGRFVIRGDLYDTWQGKKIASLAEIREAANRMDFANLGINLDELGAFTYGSGPREAVLFVDPKCPYCHALLQQVPALAGKYTFKIMVIPVLGTESERLTRVLSCAADPAAALQAVLTGQMNMDLPQQADCDLVPVQKRLVTSQLMGIKGVPFLVAPDGRTKGGLPQDLDSWLEGLN